MLEMAKHKQQKPRSYALHADPDREAAGTVQIQLRFPRELALLAQEKAEAQHRKLASFMMICALDGLARQGIRWPPPNKKR
jgi:hypothetical protein